MSTVYERMEALLRVLGLTAVLSMHETSQVKVKRNFEESEKILILSRRGKHEVRAGITRNQGVLHCGCTTR